MASKQKKHQLWLVNRIFLKAAWLMGKYSLIAVRKAASFTVSFISRKAAPAVIAKVKSRKVKGAVKAEASYAMLVPETTVSGAYDDFNSAINAKSRIILVFGRRGSGKSALGFRIMENIHASSKRGCFVLGVSKSLLPKWISEIDGLDKVDSGSVVLVDEGAISFSARESMQKKNVSLGKMLATARHKDLTLIFITQNTGMIDKNVLNLTDVIIAKEGSLLQKQMERPQIKELMEKIDAAMTHLPKEERVRYCYVFSDDFEGLCSIQLPSFWSEGISKNRSG